MSKDTKTEKNKVILPTNDLNFKRVFASPDHINISRGFLQDLAAYDPLGKLQITELSIETPYNFQEVNQLIAEHEYGILLTEVDYACYDENGIRFVLEMQKRDLSYLEERMTYNVGQKFAQHYASDPDPRKSKYVSLRPVVAIVILEDNHFKEDDIAIRFLRPHDARFDVYKKNLGLGLEIYIELNKDASKLPEKLQLWIQYFKTGIVPEEAPSYLQEAAKMIEITSLTKEEREFADRIERGKETRLLEEYTTIQQEKEAVKQQKQAIMHEKETVEQQKHAIKQQKETMEQQKAELEATIANALHDGHEKGILTGKLEGKSEGKLETKLEIARASLASGLDIQTIALITGLDAKTIENLK